MRIVQKEYQLKFIWDDVTLPQIPQENQRTMIDLCGELLFAYWEECYENSTIQQQGEKDE